MSKAHVVQAGSRFNIWVDLEDARLADTAVSTVVTSPNDVPIVVERAMYWDAPNAQGQMVTWAAGTAALGTRVR